MLTLKKAKYFENFATSGHTADDWTRTADLSFQLLEVPFSVIPFNRFLDTIVLAADDDSSSEFFSLSTLIVTSFSYYEAIRKCNRWPCTQVHLSMTRLGDLKSYWQQICSQKQLKKSSDFLGYFKKIALCKNCCGYYLDILGKQFVPPFYSNIWSHWCLTTSLQGKKQLKILFNQPWSSLGECIESLSDLRGPVVVMFPMSKDKWLLKNGKI